MSILKEYKTSLKSVETEDPFDLYFYRIISFIFVKIIYRFPITPNQISVTAMILGVVSGYFFSTATADSYFIAGIFYTLYYILDCSDGQLARLKKNGTRLGRIIDGISDYVTHIAVYIGLGIGLANQSGDALSSWFVVIVSLGSLMFQAALVDYYRNRYLEYQFGQTSLYGEYLLEFQQEYEELKKTGGSYTERFIYYVYLKYLKVQDIFISENKNGAKDKKFNTDDFLLKNEKMIRLWTYMGTSLQITLLIIASLFNIIFFYFYALVFAVNAYAIILLITQVKIDKNTTFEKIIGD